MKIHAKHDYDTADAWRVLKPGPVMLASSSPNPNHPLFVRKIVKAHVDK